MYKSVITDALQISNLVKTNNKKELHYNTFKNIKLRLIVIFDVSGVHTDFSLAKRFFCAGKAENDRLHNHPMDNNKLINQRHQRRPIKKNITLIKS